MNGETVRLALIQMDCRIKDKEYNINKAMQSLDKLQGNVDIACFPEFFTTGWSPDLIGDDFYDLAETVPGETTDRMAERARDCGVAVIGNIVEKDPFCEEILYDTSFVVNREGSWVGKYRKYYLYPVEHRYFKAGTELPVFELGSTRIGIAICYDHAFPELFRVFALKGAQIVFILSAVPTGYEYLLNLRAQARAQDNQVFIAHVNRIGKEGAIEYCGLSKVVNPKGEIIAEASPDEEESLHATVDLALSAKEKRQERVLKSLRPEIYEHLVSLLRKPSC